MREINHSLAARDPNDPRLREHTERMTLVELQRLAAGRDQAAADRDQAASDLDFVHGGDFGVHERTRALRERSTRERRELDQERVAALAVALDELERARSLVALANEQVAALRAPRGAEPEPGTEVSAADPPASLGAERAPGTEVSAADPPASLGADVATRTRVPGGRSADRALGYRRVRRMSGRLAVAYLEIAGGPVGARADGHYADDEAARRVVRTIRRFVRSYDLILRLGDRQLLCVMSESTLAITEARFDAIRAKLRADPHPCEIKVNIGELAADGSAAELIWGAQTGPDY